MKKLLLVSLVATVALFATFTDYGAGVGSADVNLTTAQKKDFDEVDNKSGVPIITDFSTATIILDETTGNLYTKDTSNNIKKIGSDVNLTDYNNTIKAVTVKDGKIFLTRNNETNLTATIDVNTLRVIDTLENLAKIKTPKDGQMIQLTGDLPVISYYVFNTASLSGTAANDGTVGFWNRVNTSGIELKDNTTGGVATTSSIYDADSAANGAIDDDKIAKGWATKKNGTDGNAGTGIVGEWLRIKTTKAFIPNGFTFYRNSQQLGGWGGNAYSPTAWEFQATKDDGVTWVTLGVYNAEEITVNAQPKYFQISPTSEAYDDYRFMFDASIRGDYVQLTEVQIVERTVASEVDTQVYKAPVADINTLKLIKNPTNGESRQILDQASNVLYRFRVGKTPAANDEADVENTGAWVKDIADGNLSAYLKIVDAKVPTGYEVQVFDNTFDGNVVQVIPITIPVGKKLAKEPEITLLNPDPSVYMIGGNYHRNDTVDGLIWRWQQYMPSATEVKIEEKGDKVRGSAYRMILTFINQ